MVTEKVFNDVCQAQGLNVITRDEAAKIFGEEEWELDIALVGFYDDPMYGAPGALLKLDGTVWVVTAFADAVKHMADVWNPVTVAEFKTGSWRPEE